MINREPTVIIGGLADIARMLVPLFLSFGLIKWGDEQTGNVMLLITVLVGVAEKIFIRSQVSPKQDIITALNMPKGSSVTELKEVIREQNATATED